MSLWQVFFALAASFLLSALVAYAVAFFAGTSADPPPVCDTAICIDAEPSQVVASGLPAFGANTWLLFLFAITLLGGFAHAAVEELRRMREVHYHELLRRIVRSPRFVVSLLVSPMVFYGVYQALQPAPAPLAAVVVAFQNGFFWQSVLKGAGFEGSDRGQGAPPGAERRDPGARPG